MASDKPSMPRISLLGADRLAELLLTWWREMQLPSAACA
jgi:hypothetical protein